MVGLAITFAIISFPINVAYSAVFEDVENSANNSFTASTLDLLLNTDFSDFEETNPIAKLKVKNNGKVDFIYEIKFSPETSDFSSSFACNYLMVEVWYNGGQIFIGDVEDFEQIYDVVLNNKLDLPTETESGEFKFSFFLSDQAPELSDDTCKVSYNVYSWQNNLEPYVGFWDEETLSFDISENNLKNGGSSLSEELISDEVSESTESNSND